MRITKKKIAVVVAATTVVALGAGSAYAYFTSTATGAGSASVGAAGQWTVTVDAVTGLPLFPGSGTQNFTYHVTNNTGAPMYLHLVTAAIDSNIDGDVANTGCKSSWFHVNIAGDPEGQVNPGDSNNGTGTITMDNVALDQTACASHNPTFTLTAS